MLSTVLLAASGCKNEERTKLEAMQSYLALMNEALAKCRTDDCKCITAALKSPPPAGLIEAATFMSNMSPEKGKELEEKYPELAASMEKAMGPIARARMECAAYEWERAAGP